MSFGGNLSRFGRPGAGLSSKRHAAVGRPVDARTSSVVDPVGFGCPDARAFDDFRHYFTCPCLTGLLYPPSFPTPADPIQRWAFGTFYPPAGQLARRAAIRRVVLAFHFYNKVKDGEERPSAAAVGRAYQAAVFACQE